MIMYDKENMNTRKNEKPWHKNAGNYLIVNSIFAVISVLFIGILFQIGIKGNHILYISVFFGIVALFILIVISEKTSEAVEEDDVKKYIAYMFPYNFVVIFFLISFDCFLWERIQPVSIKLLVFVIVVYASSIFFSIPFWQAVDWHIRSTNDEFDKYIRKLEDKESTEDGNALPERKRDWEKQRFAFTNVYYTCVRNSKLYPISLCIHVYKCIRKCLEESKTF